MDCIDKLFIHFDTQEEHYISSEQFIETVKTLQDISKSLISTLTEEPFDYEIKVFPPKSGTFLTIFGITVTVGTVLKIIESDIGKAFIKGLTEHEPAYYAENTGKLLRDLLKGFYSKTKEEINQMFSEYKKLDNAIKSKSDFYKMCLSSNNIKGLGFDDTDNFPIKKYNFIYYLSDDLIRDEGETYKYRELIIKKPVTIEQDLKWSFIDKNTKENVNAKIEDLSFKQAFLNGYTPIKESHNPDIILGKIRTSKIVINGYKEVNEHFVESVYKFNDRILKTIPDDFVLNEEKLIENEQLNFFN